MKKLGSIAILMSLLILSNLLTACNMINGVKGNGDVKKEERKHTGFNAIDIGGMANIYITQADEYKVVIEADENLLPIIKSKMKGSTLHIYNDKNISKVTELNIYISMPEIKRIELSGAVELHTTNTLSGDRLELDCSGASDLELSLKYDVVKLDFSGACDADLEGYARELSMDISGAAEVDAYELESEDVEVDASGAASIKVFASSELRADVSGASSVRYKGDATVSISKSGAASVRKN